MFPETRTGMAAKDTLRRDYTIRKKLISSNEKLRVSHKLYRMHEKAEYSLCLLVYNSMEIDDDYNNGIFIEKLNLNKILPYNKTGICACSMTYPHFT